jgi:hypothetical protein
MSNTDNLLQDFVDLDPFAAGINRTPRTVRRWIDAPDGLPYVRVGSRLMIHMPTAREWLLGRVKQRNPRRRPVKRTGARAPPI